MAYQFKFPDVGEGLHEAEIVKWLVKVGDTVQADDPLVEVQTDKSVVEIPAPVGGTILSLAKGEGELIRVGEVLVTIQPAEENQKGRVSRQKDGGAKPASPKVLTSPKVRKLARELGVDLSRVKGSGPMGRVLEEDVRHFLEMNSITNFVADIQPKEGPGTRDYRDAGPQEEEVPYIGLRRKIGEQMIKAVFTIPHTTGMGEMDVTRLVEIRKELAPYAEKQGCHLTYLPFIIKAVTQCLKEFPSFNAILDEERGKIILKKYYHIGIATATADGLLVPVIKDTDQKTILQLAQELEHLTLLARKRKISAQQLQGSTFTISNTGKRRVWFATPVINYPETAILGIHAITPRPVIREGEVVAREMMPFSLSFDHRVIDGDEAGQFMERLAEILEHPEILLLQVR